MTTINAIASATARSPRTVDQTTVPARISRASRLATLNATRPGICIESRRIVDACCAASASPTRLRSGSARRAARSTCCVRANSTIRSVSRTLVSAADRSAFRERRSDTARAPNNNGIPAIAATARTHEIGEVPPEQWTEGLPASGSCFLE